MAKKIIIEKITEEVEAFLKNDLPRIVAKEAVDEFRENFVRQGFRNNGVQRWPEVKRRMPNSPWYGFQYKGERRSPKDRKKKGQKRKLNYSLKYTKYDILRITSNLYRSVTSFEVSPERVEIGSDLPYAQVQNDGGYIKVFGKAKVKLPKRQFIGESKELMDELERILIQKIDNLTNT